MNKTGIIALAMMVAATANASTAQNNGKAQHQHNKGGMCSFVPENNLWIAADSKTDGGITEEEFFDITNKLEKIYAPIIKKAGGTLQVKKLWSDGTVNASATQSGGVWTVNMYGGLARFSSMTYDGFVLVMCHELGHHLAGYPKVSNFGFPTWASNEGQSDYYATMKCFREIYSKADNDSIVSKMEIPGVVKEACTVQHKTDADIALCERGAMGGAVLARVLGELGRDKEPQFDTPDTNEVRSTNNSHPKAQCRMDTYFNGAVCGASHKIEFGKKDAATGACAEERGDNFGVRPRCWYKPNL